MKKSGIKATSLRTFMIIVIVIIVGASGGGFYYAQDLLSKLTTSINQTAPKITTPGLSTKDLAKLQKDVADNQASVSKVDSLFFSSTDYKNQATKDLDKYATAYGVTADNSAQPATTQTKNSITLTLKNPVPFTNLMHFIEAVETNTPKMQITDMTISRIESSKTDVTVGPLTIKVYTTKL